MISDAKTPTIISQKEAEFLGRYIEWVYYIVCGLSLLLVAHLHPSFTWRSATIFIVLALFCYESIEALCQDILIDKWLAFASLRTMYFGIILLIVIQMACAFLLFGAAIMLSPFFFPG